MLIFSAFVYKSLKNKEENSTLLVIAILPLYLYATATKGVMKELE